jgi:ribosomal protein S3
VWGFVCFLGKLLDCLKDQNTSLHGARLQIVGRFRGSKRPKKVRLRYGQLPFNTLRARIDYAYSPAITLNGTFGIKAWLCYK